MIKAKRELQTFKTSDINNLHDALIVFKDLVNLLYNESENIPKLEYYSDNTSKMIELAKRHCKLVSNTTADESHISSFYIGLYRMINDKDVICIFLNKITENVYNAGIITSSGYYTYECENKNIDIYEDIDLEFSYKLNISEIAQYYFIDNIREFLIMVCNRILSLSNLELELIDENEYMRIRGNKNDSTSKK